MYEKNNGVFFLSIILYNYYILIDISFYYVGIIEGLEDGENVEEPSGIRYPCNQCDKTFQTKQSYEVNILVFMACTCEMLEK